VKTLKKGEQVMKGTGFLALDKATELYWQCEKLRLREPIKSQLLRASLSIALNITEGSGRVHFKDRRRFYSIAMGSLRETQCLIRILRNEELAREYDRLGGLIYGLVRKAE
jgi:four helix bundle protein